MSTCRRILIVDDEEQVLFVWSNALRKPTNKYYIETARSGDEALHKIEEALFDLVITDLRMPGLSGQELTQAIKNLKPEQRVIWITAHRNADVDAEAERLEVTCCLDKPLTVAQIRQIVPQVLELADCQRPDAPAGM